MIKQKAMNAIALFMVTVFVLAACGGNGNGNDATDSSPPGIRQLLANCNTRPVLGEFDDNARFDDVNLVDIRFEIVSLVFRLAGQGRFTPRTTMYQHSLHNTFSDFAEHPVVTLASQIPTMPVGTAYSHILSMAAHLRYANGQFTIQDDLSSLVFDNGLWTHESVSEFINLLNDFYFETNFADFFAENIDVYMTQSERALRLAFRPLRFDWFEARGMQRDNMRVVVVPSVMYSNFVHITAEGIVYIIIAELRAGEAWASFRPFMLGNLVMPLQGRVADEMLAQNPDFYAFANNLSQELNWPVDSLAPSLVAVALLTLYRIDTEPDFDIASELNSLSNMFLGMVPDGIEDVLRMVIAHECNC